MKLVSYAHGGHSHAGLFIDGAIYDLAAGAVAIKQSVPADMNAFLAAGESAMTTARQVQDAVINGSISLNAIDATLLAPVPKPPSCRDAYAFRQHVATARRNRGVDMIPEFDQFPVFYFTNHNSVIGGGDLEVESDHLHKLDFELEAAIVIGRHGKNIPAAEADQYIAGLTIMNDFSARVLQMEEMKLSLGPAKGKDFATSIGPWLVTLDELRDKSAPSSQGVGTVWNLSMKAWHNGTQVSEGNLADMNWTFAEIIERVSYGVEIFPGDVIGSGTVGTGCYLELNGTGALEAKKAGREFMPTWLEDGDSIDLEIEGLGRLSHTVRKALVDRSILAKKKNVEPAAV